MIFEVKNASFGYSQENLLYKDINFAIGKGEVLSILGTNGSGKTTMLKCMMGFLNWTTGTTYMKGVALDEIPEKDIWKSVSYVPQAKGNATSIKAKEMVVFGRSPYLNMYNRPKKEDREIVDEIMDQLKIGYLKDKECSKMSGGELQMVLIARALVSFPELIILDEPESNLDFRNQLIILNTLEELAKVKNISCIINTHYPNHALKISDRTIMIDKEEKSIEIGNSRDVITEENLRKTFKVDVSIDNINIKGKDYNTITPVSLI